MSHASVDFQIQNMFKNLFGNFKYEIWPYADFVHFLQRIHNNKNVKLKKL